MTSTGDGLAIDEFGDAAIMITAPAEDELQRRLRLRELQVRIDAHRPHGVVDVVAGLESLLVEFDPRITTHGAVADVSRLLTMLPAARIEAPKTPSREFEIPVVFDAGAGPDLESVAEELGTDVDGVIAAITASRFTVALLAAGMAPMMDGGTWAKPVRRRAEPRTDVPPGSIMIAAGNAIIQPFPGPTGWRVVGRTPFTIVDIQRTPAAAAMPGDVVRFVPITRRAAAELRDRFLEPLDGAS